MSGILGTIKHFFIPSEQNNYRAKILHLDILSLFLFFAIVLSVFTTTQIGQQILGFAIDIKTEQLLTYVHEVRTSHGLQALKLDSSLTVAAQNKANNMFANNY